MGTLTFTRIYCLRCGDVRADSDFGKRQIPPRSLAQIPAANACTIAPTCRRVAIPIRQTFLPEDILSSGSHSPKFLTLLQAVAVTFGMNVRGMGDKMYQYHVSS